MSNTTNDTEESVKKSDLESETVTSSAKEELTKEPKKTKQKGRAIFYTGLVTLFVLGGVAGYSASFLNTNKVIDKEIVTTSNGSVRQSDLYKLIQSSPTIAASDLVVNATFKSALGNDFEDAGSDEKVDEIYNTMKKQYGDNFNTALKQQGFTTKTYKESVRLQLREKAALESEIEKDELTDAKLEEAWKTYQPTVKGYVIQYSSKSEAENGLASASDSKKFKSENSAALVSFNSLDTSINNDVRKAAYDLKVNTGKVVTTKDTITNASGVESEETTYYVVYPTEKATKGKTWKDDKDAMKESIIAAKEQDSAYVSQKLGQYLKSKDTKVIDSTFDTYIDSYLDAK